MPPRTPQPLLPLRTVAILNLAGLIGLCAGYLTAITGSVPAGVLAGIAAAGGAVVALHHIVGE